MMNLHLPDQGNAALTFFASKPDADSGFRNNLLLQPPVGDGRCGERPEPLPG